MLNGRRIFDNRCVGVTVAYAITGIIKFLRGNFAVGAFYLLQKLKPLPALLIADRVKDLLV